MSITVYSLPRCVQCDATKRALKKQGLAYVEVDMAADEQAREHAKSLGYTAAPIVFAGEDHWSGYRPDKIKAVSVQLAALSA